jgi:hypothetical protein
MSDSKALLIFPAFFNGYINLTENNDILSLLKDSIIKLESDMEVLKKQDFDFAYDQGKWSIGQLLQHCIDAEQIFAYRALTIARDDKRLIRSFDENQYAKASVNSYNCKDLTGAMLLARRFTYYMFKGFHPDWLEKTCQNEQNEDFSVRSIGHICIGHWLHHKNVLVSRYKVDFD